MKTIIYLFFLIPLSASVGLAQLADVDGTIRSSANTPRVELYDMFDSRVESLWEEFSNQIYLYSTHGDLRLGATEDGVGGLPVLMTLKADNKRVGINTTTPTSVLQVNNEASSRSIGFGGITQVWKDGSTILGTFSHVFDALLIQNQKVAPAENTSTFSLQTTKKDGTAPIQFTIDGKGEIGLGSFASDPTAAIHLKHRIGNDSDDGVRFENEGANGNHFTLYVSNGNGFLNIFSKVGGNIRIADINDVSGAYTALSDARFKHDIKTLTPVLEKVTRLKPVSYYYNHQVNKEERFSGFLAQELNTEFPEYVSYDVESDIYGVDYAGLSTIAIKAIQEQQLQINNQQQKIDALRTEINVLKNNYSQRLDRIERQLKMK